MKGRAAPRSCWALILAGGSGERLGLQEPKAFASLGGRPLLAWSLRTLAEFPWITDVQLVAPAGWTERADAAARDAAARDAAARDGAARDEGPGGSAGGVEPSAATPGAAAGSGSGAPSPVRRAARVHPSIPGGPRRQDSARIGLEAIAGRVSPEEQVRTAVLIHDAARPVISTIVLRDLLIALQAGAAGSLGTGGSAPAPVGIVPLIPQEDTLKRYEGDLAAAGAGQPVRVTGTTSRDRHARVQTPQAFHLDAILRAHRAAAAGDAPVTDDAALFERQGWPIRGVRGSSLSLKVTYPEDLLFLEGWLAHQEAVRSGDV